MIYLTKRDPAKNMARFYALDLQPNLFGEWSLVKAMGPDRTGGAGAKRSLWREGSSRGGAGAGTGAAD